MEVVEENMYATSFTADQEQAFRAWVDRFNWNSRPSVKQANDYLSLKFSLSFPENIVTAVIDQVHAGKEPPPVREVPSSPPRPVQASKPATPVHTGKIRLPGYGMSITHHSAGGKGGEFPVLVADSEAGWKAHTLLIREYCMLEAIESLTNKPEWWHKVRDPEIAAKWRDEMLAMDWQPFHRYADFTPNMADACIEELRLKADMYEQTGLVPVFDYSACVLKSDNLFDADLTRKLVEQLKPLEDVPEAAKDWHPGSDGKVLDLVHPSLWPLVFGRTRIMPDNEINLDDCMRFIGAGEVIPKPSVDEQRKATFWGDRDVPTASVNFQWLPCNVELNPGGKARITSYINNLHPVEHKGLYPVIEEFISKSLPAWDLVYRWPKEFRFQRLSTMEVGPDCTVPEVCGSRWECTPASRPLKEGEAEREEDEEYEDDYEGSVREQLDTKWFYETHPLKLPDAEPSIPPTDAYQGKVKTTGFFDNASRLQVIVKLANIHLTPEKPHYDGGSWHLEGQQNEHIVATALYYYDNDNITESLLYFRTSADSEGLSMNLNYMQSDVRSIARTFAVEQRHEASTLQDVGSVTTREGRAVFFPNLFLHRVDPFGLRDKTRPGHRKILALFLVDPEVPVISTANVPPQQRHWWPGEGYVRDRLRLPAEVGEMVLDQLDFPYDEAEARRIREQLMAERKTEQTGFVRELKSVEFGFCEH
ncbi:WD40 repeat 2 [Cordyceps javanica]|uniref:WD40 repeat 2 n=1 Tax=Cordyceps javanica TaxID=43265 RepID=A0A545VTV5_9HYPO|nr:WD40 repeat 2 [Cordyceps javanica]TQW05150.1 WD40 repeat 2 [Cordyceps javanica]